MSFRCVPVQDDAFSSLTFEFSGRYFEFKGSAPLCLAHTKAARRLVHNVMLTYHIRNEAIHFTKH
jgi:hypothetical protein